jgi:glutamate-1-semialdehyde 2,1-aminomutase
VERPKSKALLEANRKVIPGGVVSVNRATTPEISFNRGVGCRIWDVDGNEYIDYHAGFAPFVLGHNDPDVNAAVTKMFDDGLSLIGAGTNPWEGRLAELIVGYVPSVDKVMLTNTGSEATYHALRIARAVTGHDHLIVMQGGYNGWHNDVALNIMNSLEDVGPRVSSGEYPRRPLSAGIPAHVLEDVHVVNFNDLDSVAVVIDQNPVAAIILEPILQNIGIVKPQPGYLEGLRELCDRTGVVLVFDEVKTGFRHALGGYQSICGVHPDLSTFGKALANGYPMGAIGGREEFMNRFIDPDPLRRVLIAGTYNAHPIPTVAAIATLEKLAANDGQSYDHLYGLGERLESGLESVFDECGVTATVARQGSAFCVYFMDHAPRDWHDIAEHHDFELDKWHRDQLIKNGVFHFPLPTKQGSISLAHSEKEIDRTVEIVRDIFKNR